MRHIMISIKPEWVEKIIQGKKILEIRKSIPQDLPCKVYIYCTKDMAYKVVAKDLEQVNGKVCAEFTLNYIECWRPKGLLWSKNIDKTCLTMSQLCNYAETNKRHKDHCYAWRIDDLKIYDKPKELAEFGLKRPPQSWCYIGGEDDESVCSEK